MPPVQPNQSEWPCSPDAGCYVGQLGDMACGCAMVVDVKPSVVEWRGLQVIWPSRCVARYLLKNVGLGCQSHCLDRQSNSVRVMDVLTSASFPLPRHAIFDD